ncbi:MAG: hypothetical protein IPM53_14405 [Anaerolineaceae bacterium]|nr:hypothetical protein [Anaerolineaceae bacterium]
MSLAIRRKFVYLLAAAALALMLAGTTLTTPVFADCTTGTMPACGG